MKLIIKGKTIPSNFNYLKLCKTMSNPTTQAIINEITNSFQLTSSISKKCGLSQSTIYRILTVLKMFNLVTTKISIDKKGNKRIWYKSQFNSITIN